MLCQVALNNEVIVHQYYKFAAQAWQAIANAEQYDVKLRIDEMGKTTANAFCDARFLTHDVGEHNSATFVVRSYTHH